MRRVIWRRGGERGGCVLLRRGVRQRDRGGVPRCQRRAAQKTSEDQQKDQARRITFEFGQNSTSASFF